MSLFPALMTLVIVMMLAASSTRLAQDAGLLAAQRTDGQLARLLADHALRRAAADLSAHGGAVNEVVVDEVAISEQAELSDLPLQLHRLTATSQGHQAPIRLQADYALVGCDTEYDAPCTPRVRRIAWRELPF